MSISHPKLCQPIPTSRIRLRRPGRAVEALVRENAEMKDRLLRTLAEMEDLRRRTEREIADGRAYAVTGFARDALAVADNVAARWMPRARIGSRRRMLPARLC